MRILEREREGKAYLCLGNNPVYSGQIRLYANAIRSRAMSCLFPSRGTESRSGMPDPNKYLLFTAVQPTERSVYQTSVLLEFQGSLPVLVP